MTAAIRYNDAPGYKEAVLKWSAEFLPGAVAQGTEKRYRVSLGQLGPHFEGKRIAEIRRHDIADYIAARKGAATNATIRRDLTALSSILRFAVAKGWRDDNPAKEFDRSIIRERRDPIQYVTDAALEAVIAEASDMMGRIMRIAAETGMRQGEIVGLKWSEVDLDRGEITLRTTKTNRARVVPLMAMTVGTIAGTPRFIGSPYVFWRGRGDRYRNFSSLFARVRDRAKQNFRFHDLRHKFAIDYLRVHGRDRLPTLSLILGHSSVKTTEIYLDHVVAEMGTGATVRSSQAVGGKEEM